MRVFVWLVTVAIVSDAPFLENVFRTCGEGENKLGIASAMVIISRTFVVELNK